MIFTGSKRGTVSTGFMRFPLLILLGIVPTACMGPAIKVPEPARITSESWGESLNDSQLALGSGAPASTVSALEVPGEDFWQRFGTPDMAELVARARAANPTIEAARARVAQLRGQARVAGAALLPTVGLNASATATRTDNSNTALYSYSVGQAGLDVAYDLDLFGAARAGKRAARARVTAAAFDGDAAALVVETDAARALVQWAALGDRIAVAERDSANARELLRILNVRLREGVATRVDVGLQSGELARLEAQHSSLIEARAQMSAGLAALLGLESPRFKPRPLSLDALVTPAIGVGQPGELLFRRPDIRAAEARIAAARGDVQQARAAFKPSLRLSGSGLVQAAAIGGPFGITLSAGASLFAPIFQGGRLRGQYETASAVQIEAVALYRAALLRALTEGDQALAGMREAGRRRALYDRASRDVREASRLARVQFLEGEIPLDTLIDTERNETQTNDAALVARQDELLAVIDLFKALGGAPSGRGVPTL